MTNSEAHIELVKRIGWRDDKTVEGFILSAENLLGESGRVFQSEHSAITLENIKECQPLKEILDVDFNLYLRNLRNDCIWQVLNDVFEKDYVNNQIFAKYPTSFDNCILLRMVINVSEMIMTSSRSNKIKRFGDEFVGKLNYDVFRDAPNKFAIRGANYNHTMGISTRYSFELQSCQRRFGNLRNLLKTITKGAVYEPFSRGCSWN
jgi:hypothetical protein